MSSRLPFSPRALLQVAMHAAPATHSIDEYELEDELGRGGMGVVYRAHQRSPDRCVALKKIQLAGLPTRDARERFLREVEFLARFEHPNIVRIYDAKGLHGDDPYYTMQLIEGGSLAQQRARFAEPARAARLMATVARAVQFCHDAQPNPILHRDLKPENVLLGPDDHPYLSDFGIAKAVDRAGGTRPSAVIGTVEYMAPELMLGRPASPRSEVYSLGAVLYELLTGLCPYGTGPTAEVMQRALYEELVPPRQHVRALDRGLDQICRVALEKDPARRYPSAAALADDLDRVLRGEAAQPPLLSASSRMLHWMRLHPLVSVGLSGLIGLALVVTAAAVWLLRAQEQKLLDSARQINAFAARAQAGAMLNQIRDYAAQLERAASELAQASMESGSCLVLDAPLERYVSGFDGLSVFTQEGRSCQRWPQPDALPPRRDFSFRDYFRGADRLGRAGVRAAFVAPSIRSETDHHFNFALSVPLFDAEQTYRGVLLAWLNASTAFGAVTIDDRSHSGLITALLGPRGAERSDRAPRRGQYVVLIHPKLPYGRGVQLPRAYAAQLERRFGASKVPGHQLEAPGQHVLLLDDYRDAVPGSEGRWLSAFAPVGSTGYVVLVQSRYEDAPRTSRMFGRIAAYLGLASALGTLAVWFVMLKLNRRRGL